MLKDHIVAITGSGSGLGLGVARHFARQGATLALFDIDAAKLDAIRPDFPDRTLLVRGDITKVADIESFRGALLNRFGRVDAVVGTQGIFDGNVRLKDIALERVATLFDELFHINVLGYILTARIFADDLRRTKGAMVFTLSTAAYAADGGGAFYTASKGAVRSLVHQLAFEYAPDIRVNGVAPAGIASSQLRGPQALGLQNSRQSDIPAEAFREHFARTMLIKDLPQPDDYGPLYALLASRENRTMTGQTMIADQGLFNRPVISS